MRIASIRLRAFSFTIAFDRYLRTIAGDMYSVVARLPGTLPPARSPRRERRSGTEDEPGARKPHRSGRLLTTRTTQYSASCLRSSGAASRAPSHPHRLRFHFGFTSLLS
jgi:hypothetical protein